MSPRTPAAPAVTGTPLIQESVLDQVDLFRPLPDAIKKQLESHLKRKPMKAGEVLFNQGDVGDAMYLVVNGMMAVFLTDATLGLCVELARLGPGQSTGEMALVTGAPRSASVRAVEDSQVLQLSREIFYHLVQAAPQMGLIIAGVLAKRLDQVNKSQGIEFGTLKGRQPDAALLESVGSALIKRHRMIPVNQTGGVVLVATPDPSNRLGLDDVKRMIGEQQVQLMAVSEVDYANFINTYLKDDKVTAAARPGTAGSAQVRAGVGPLKPVRFLQDIDEQDARALTAQAQSQDSRELVSSIVAEAIERGASDVHIDPERKNINIRYRVDGRMIPRDAVVPVSALPGVLTRLKVLAQINITERRLPQDGRISLEYGGKPFDLRMATVNTKYGEKATLRLLDSSKLDQNLTSLVVAEKVSAVMRKLFYRPNGLVLVTGPTGSGKTTTLYAALRERVNKEVSIVTVEDPIEYDLPGVVQVQVNENIGLGFAEVIRTFMRSDPNIMLVGELRDATTAKLACNAALTGHLVLSSFHTNDAISSVVRLKSMQVEPYLIASALLGVVNQRLVRRICPACRVEAPVTELIIKNLQASGVPLEPGGKFFKGAGCEKCNNEGFKGRVGVYELLLMSGKVREAVANEDSSAAEIRTAAADGSYVPLARFAAHLLQNGYTVPSEIIRILPRDDHAGV